MAQYVPQISSESLQEKVVLITGMSVYSSAITHHTN